MLFSNYAGGMPKSKIFLFILLSFIGGVGARSFLTISLASLFIIFLAAAVCIGVGISKKIKYAILVGVFAVAFLAGATRFSHKEYLRPDLSSFFGMRASYRGIVWDEPRVTANSQQMKIKILEKDNAFFEKPFFVLATAAQYPRYFLGDDLEIIDSIEEPMNFGEFDYVSYLKRDQIFGVFSFPDIVKKGEKKGNIIKMFLSRARHSFEENIDDAIGEPHAAFLKGLLLGERESLPEELVSDFNRTGTTHIIALSGYNITLVARFFVAFLIFLTLPFNAAFWIASFAIVLFVILVGASPSATRAGFMGILLLLAQREGRMYNIRNALAFAGALMVFENPYILRFDAAFQLSFLAALGLVYLSPHVESFLKCMRHKIRSLVFGLRMPDPRAKNIYTLGLVETGFVRIKSIFIETLSAQLMVLPYLIFLFGRVSLVSPFANLFVIVAIPYSMALGFITGVTGFFSPSLGVLAGSVNWLFLEYKIRVIEFFSHIPHASLSITPFSGVFVIIFYVFLAYLLFRGQKKQV